VSMFTDHLSQAIKSARGVLGNDARMYVRDTADEMLAGYGFVRRPSFLASILPLAGAFSTGVVVGGVAALLLAPKSGAELRADLMNSARGIRDRVTGAVQPKGTNGSSSEPAELESPKGSKAQAATPEPRTHGIRT
jgi:hypothetical protein